MHSFLKQSTASQSRSIGPFLDDTDFKTAETGLTIANTDIKLMINGAASADKNSGGGTHRANGVYGVTFDATDTATVGEIFVSVVVAGALPVFATFVVLEEAVYDALFAASAPGYLQPTTAGRTLDVSAGGEAGIDWANVGSPTTAVNLSATNIDVDQVVASVSGAVASVTGNVGGNVAGSVASVTATVSANVVSISGDSTAADNLETLLDDTAGQVPWAGIVDQGTAQSATATTLVLRAAAAFANDELIGATIVITGGDTGVGQSRLITDYVSASDTATVETWTTTPSGTITYKIFATAPSTGGAGLDAAGVRSAIGLASANLDTQLSGLDTKLDTIDNFLDTEVAAILADTNELQTDWADGGRLDLILDARASQASVDTVDTVVDAILVDTTEIGAAGAGLTALATQASVNTIDDFLDTEVAAIKAKTDSLTFTTAGMVDAAIKRVGDTTITAAGTGGQGYGAA